VASPPPRPVRGGTVPPPPCCPPDLLPPTAMRECPSCALEFEDEQATECPYCGYEFPAPQKTSYKLIAVLLALLLAWPILKLVMWLL
jgi:uncharacterized paraquat-inducible protein A